MQRHRRLLAPAVALAIAVAAGGTVVVPPARAQLEETPEVFPEGTGRDETFYTCTACHGSAIIRSQGMSRQRWDATIDDMIAKNMPAPTAADRDLIVEYLSTVFPPRQRGAPNPFLR